MPPTQIINSANYYDRTANDFDRYSNSKMNYLNSINNLILGEIAPGKTVIDIGSGSGTRICKLSSSLLPQKLLCIDSSTEMLKKCEQYKLPVIKYDIASENLEKHGEFEVALCLWNVLGHISSAPARRLALKYIYKNLAPRGKLIIDVNNRYNIKNYGFKNVARNFLLDKLNLSSGDFDLKLTDDHSIITKVHIFTKDEIINLIKKTGFQITKIHYFNYESGNKEKNSWLGQIAVIATKP